MPVSRRPERRSTVIVAGFITAILLIVIGTLMDRHERAERERRWRR